MPNAAQLTGTNNQTNTVPPLVTDDNYVGTAQDQATPAKGGAANDVFDKAGNVDIQGLYRIISNLWPVSVNQHFTLYGRAFTISAIADGYIYVSEDASGYQVAIPNRHTYTI